MQALDKLFATGLPVFDLNREHLDRWDWSKTPLGPRDAWPPTLKSLVNSCVLPMPHCAALFWGHDLTVVENLAWERARGQHDGQAARAINSYDNEALSTLRVVLRGRSVKVAASVFLQDLPQASDLQLLLNTVYDESATPMGILAQLLESAASKSSTPNEGLDQFVRESQMDQEEPGEKQQAGNRGTNMQTHLMQTQLLQRFAELLPTGLAILDKNAETIFVNDGFFKLTTNKSRNEFRAWPESIHPDDYNRVISDYRRAFESRSELRTEFRCARDASHEREGETWRLFLLKPLSEDHEAGFMSAIIDITDIKEAQLAQERAARDAQDRKEQQERFIDMVSHEIRNPLSAVLHLAEEVKEVTKQIHSTHKDLQEQVDDILAATDTILLCVSHQNTLVDDILSFSKLDSMMMTLVPREVRPKWEFGKALRVFHSEFKAKNIKFHYAIDVSYDDMGIDYVIADLNRMNQVLVNLMTNAIKFTSQKSGERKVHVSLGASRRRPTSYPPNVIFFSEDKDSFHLDSTMTSEWGGGSAMYLMVAVKDTGIGINEDGQTRLFERFRQATPKTQVNYGGSGLGLFISRKLCQLHGGDIGVSSKEGEGSTFGFFFRVRISDGTSEDGRPPFQSRSNSENSGVSVRSLAQGPRPGYNRANSTLANIKEQHKERCGFSLLSSSQDIDSDDPNALYENPPVEYVAESHPESAKGSWYEETERIVKNIKPENSITQHKDIVSRDDTQRHQDTKEDTHASHSARSAGNKQTLLLVEDNLINQNVLRRQLQTRGFEVVVANNGQEAIDAVIKRGKGRGNTSDRGCFDCILMDQEMPVKDGNAATQEIRELQDEGKAGRSRILGVSANVREAQTKGMRDAGMDDVISKPFKVDDLVKRIKGLLKEDEDNENSMGHKEKRAGSSTSDTAPIAETDE